MVIRRTSIDFGILKVKFQSVREEIANSKNISSSHREILLYLYDQLIDGINKNQLNKYNDSRIPLFSMLIEEQHIFVKVKHRFSETIKSFKDVKELPELITIVEDTTKKCGLKFERMGNNELMEVKVYQESEKGDQ